MTADWLRKWKLQITHHNTPQMQRIPAEMDYLRLFAMDTA
jgi:hypothetical protein